MDPIPLARELVQIDSPTGQEGPVAVHLSDRLTEFGYNVVRQEVTPGRWNVYATRDEPVVVLSTHLDTVPPNLPFNEDDKFLYGRGSTDAKGIAAVQVAAAERFAARGECRVGLLFLVGEELASDGAKAAATLEPKGRFMINGEPTENRLAAGGKGAVRIQLKARGRSAHSAHPELGRSAIVRMLEALDRIRHLPLPRDEVLGDTTLNIGYITGGVAPNVVPPECTAEVLFRTVEETTQLKTDVLALAGEHLIIDVPWEIPPLRLKPLPDYETTVVAYGTDLPWLEAWGERFLLGPGSILVAHTEHERAVKQELADGVAVYERLISDLLRTA